jgi:hypothetical protein
MSLYLIPFRSLNRTNQDIPLSFPAQVTAQITFGPEDAFGLPTERRTTVAVGQPTKFSGNANEGSIQLEGALIERLEAEFQVRHFRVRLNGNVLTLVFTASSYHEATQTLNSTHQLLVPIITHRLRTYVWIKLFTVMIGTGAFDFVLSPITRQVVAATTEQNTERIKESLVDWTGFKEEHRPFFSALSYFRQAYRLALIQPGAEPMVSEILLNLAKAIEVIFRSNKHEEIRRQAATWGFPSDEIEEVMLPILILRSNLDVAHVALAQLTVAERDTVVAFSLQALSNMEAVIDRVSKGLFSGSIRLTPISGAVAKDKRKLLTAIGHYMSAARKRKSQPL